MKYRLLRHSIAAALVACAAIACGKSDGGKAAKAQVPAVPVTATTVAPRSWSDVIEALGTAKANESLTLTAKVTETVRRIRFADGQNVDAGDILVELTAGQQVAQLEDAQAMSKDAQRQYERQQDLVKQGTVSKQLFETQMATRDSTKAKVDAIRAQLSDRVITAPFGGVLGLRQVSAGALVAPGTPIVTLDDIHIIKVDFAVPEIFLGNLQPGLTVKAKTPAFPQVEFEGKINTLDSRVDPATRAIIVRALVPNAEGRLRPGMLLNVEVFSRSRDALTVPEMALVPIGARQYVYRIGADNLVHQVEVKLGGRRTGEVEIVSGVDSGDKIVVEGTVTLREGSRVAVASPPAASAAAASQ